MKGFNLTALTALLVLLSASASAEPMAYSVNSDQPLGDTLHEIDLSTGAASPVGVGVTFQGTKRRDVEGLAIAPDLSLWGVDEEQQRLFQIDTVSGAVIEATDRQIQGITADAGNDYGMTYTCDGTLYVSSVTAQSLYTLDTETGIATLVGSEGSLGVNISAIAAYGKDPVRMYGLGNGFLGEAGPVDNRSLYSIDPTTGTTQLIGTLGGEVADYAEAGLGFDSSGRLWGITDRSQFAGTSQVLRIDTETGAANVIANTLLIGFESLAVAPPGNCEIPRSGPDLDDPTLWVDVPTFDNWGKLATILVLLLTGLVAIRQRLF